MVETPHSYHLAGASSSTSPAMGHHQQPQGEEEAPLHCEAIEVRRAFRAFHPEDAGRVLQFGLKPDGAALGPKKSKVPLKSMLAEWNDAFGGIAALQQGGASSAGKVSSRSNGNSSSSRSRGHVGNITTATGGGGGEAQQPLSVVPSFGAGSPRNNVAVFTSIRRALQVVPPPCILLVFDIAAGSTSRLAKADCFSSLDVGTDCAVCPLGQDVLLGHPHQTLPRFGVWLPTDKQS
jgi:hypothetical protein